MTSFLFHDGMDNLLAYTKSEEAQLQIREVSSAAIPHPTNGEILAFCESKVYNAPTVQTASSKQNAGLQIIATEVLQSTLLRQMVEAGKYKMAYSLATLGVTMADWRYRKECWKISGFTVI